MGEFKPMVKMYTTEPSVELKLKKGGSATHKRMHAEGAKEGFKPVKKMDGGVMGALSRAPAPTTPMGNLPAARAMAAKRPPMRAPAAPARGVPAVGRPVAPAAPMGRPMMKKGGEVETAAQHKAEMKAIKGVDTKLTKHAAKPASVAHKGLKTGGVAKSTKPGEYKTGGVVDGQGGFKKGGSVATANGIIKSKVGQTTKVVGATPDRNSAPTGDVKMGNAGGFKKGGTAKKAFATGGVVDTGRAVAMPKKAPSKPVAISQLAGTFKKGGRVC